MSVSRSGRRLWSLWDMKIIFAKHIVIAAGQLERIEAVYQSRSKEAGFDADTEVPTKLKNGIADRYAKLADSAEAMGASVTAKFARLAVKQLRGKKKPVSFSELTSVTKQINNTLEFETDGVKLYCLPSGAEAYYSPEEPLFGREVAARIGKAADDISEAGKCFAVGRYTASVFHLMRAMEAAVQKVSSELGIENVEREWGKLLSDIHKKIEPMAKGETRDSWSQVHANLYHVKQAWRNDTMHPKATYTEEEAREVFDAMRAFMRHLASMLPPSVEELIG